jgi:hypothetical protein
MAELLDVLNAFSTLVKIGWAAWLAGGIVLWLAYRLARVMPHAVVSTVTTPRRRVVPAAANTVSRRSASIASSSADAVVQSHVAPAVVMVESIGAGRDGVAVAGAEPPAPSNASRRRRRTRAVPASEHFGGLVAEIPSA